jgi:hypothetical protein
MNTTVEQILQKKAGYLGYKAGGNRLRSLATNG